jgi:5-methylcytosine-specific restriction protein A
MPRLRQLPPLVRPIDTRTVRPPPRKSSAPNFKNPIYDTPAFRRWRAQVIARAGGRCEHVDAYGNRCPKAYPKHRVYADHRTELKDGGQPCDLNNGQCLCASHHELKTHSARTQRLSR